MASGAGLQPTVGGDGLRPWAVRPEEALEAGQPGPRGGYALGPTPETMSTCSTTTRAECFGTQ